MIQQFGSIYLDHNATTPLHPEVSGVLRQHLSESLVGNPSSLHGPGRVARALLEKAREQLSLLLGVEPSELFFTSGGTESNNALLLGIAESEQPLWISATEHPSVREAAKKRWAEGAPGGELPVTESGLLDMKIRSMGWDFEGALVSLQWVNNETGTVQLLRDWVDWFHQQGALVHTDGAQGFFRLPVKVSELGVDAATITAHKSFGPTGVGALWVRRGVVLDPILRGGPQERKVRPGTENLLAIVGMGALAEICQRSPLWELGDLTRKAEEFRSQLSSIPGLRGISPISHHFPNCISVTLQDLVAETVLVRLDLEGIAASSGSACSSGAREPSHVLAAMGVPEAEIQGALRFSLGPQSSDAELSFVVDRLRVISEELRGRRG